MTEKRMISSAKEKLIRFHEKKKRMPSYREMLELFGYKSKNAVFKLVEKLIEHDIVTKDSSGRLLPGRVFGALRVLGQVQAGFPSPAEEELADTMSLDEFLIEKKEATFMLKVSGDSMIDAGIHEGDLVLVERGRQPRDGDIVIAEVDNEWTMKYYRKRGSTVFLEAANKKYKPIYPEGELNVSAVVKAVVRKY